MTNTRMLYFATALAVAVGSTSLYVWGQQPSLSGEGGVPTVPPVPSTPIPPRPLETIDHARDFRGAMMGMAPPMESFRARRNPEVGTLERAAVKLSHQYAAASNADERAQIAANLRSVVIKQFNLRQESRGKELDALEAQLARLRATHQRRADQAEAIVDDRVEDLLRDAEGLGWGSSAGLGVRGEYGNAGGGMGMFEGAAIENRTSGGLFGGGGNFTAPDANYSAPEAGDDEGEAGDQ